jgi:phenylalanyl-tRNA synthetase alpha chain
MDDHPEIRMHVPDDIANKIGVNLHRRPDHPIGIVARQVEMALAALIGAEARYTDLDPVVTTEDNFDRLLVPRLHVSRRSTDTFYLDDDLLLRTHTTSHLSTLLARHRRFVVIGDVYRREDPSPVHSSVFHQAEAVKVVDGKSDPVDDLRATVENLLDNILGDRPRRVTESYFTYAAPSFEYEIEIAGRWVEVAGCGVIKPATMARSGRSGEQAWGIGVGLDRLAMALCEVPDIALFWTDDSIFSQYSDGRLRPYAPLTGREMFFLLPEGVAEHVIYDLVWRSGNGLVRAVNVTFGWPADGQVPVACSVEWETTSPAVVQQATDLIVSLLAELGADFHTPHSNTGD